MNSYEVPKDQAAAYHIGKLDAQLRAEREARIRAEQTVACLLGLRVDEHGPPASSNLSGSGTASKSDAGLLQQRLEELRLELELEKLKAEIRHDKRRGSNAVLGGAVHASPAKMEDALPAETAIDPPTVYDSSEQFAKRTEFGHQDRSEETDIPAAEWMHPTKKEERKPKEATKPRHKSYFAPSSAAAPGDVTAVAESAEVELYPCSSLLTSANSEAGPRSGARPTDCIRKELLANPAQGRDDAVRPLRKRSSPASSLSWPSAAQPSPFLSWILPPALATALPPADLTSTLLWRQQVALLRRPRPAH